MKDENFEINFNFPKSRILKTSEKINTSGLKGRRKSLYNAIPFKLQCRPKSKHEALRIVGKLIDLNQQSTLSRR